MKNKSISLMVMYGWLTLFALIPMILIMVTSFLSQNEATLFSLPLTFKNYTSLLSLSFATIVLRSMMMAIMTTSICLILAYPFSYLLIQSKRQSLFLILIIIPFWTSSLVRTYSLLALLKFKGGINTFFLKLHLISTPLTLLYTNTATIAGLIYTLFPFMVLPIFTHMERFDFRLLNAARDLGATRLQVFFRVFLPNTFSGIKAGCLFVFLPAMTLFYIPNILGGARSLLLGNVIQNQFLVVENWPLGAATSAVLTLSVLILLLVLRREPEALVR